MEESAYRYSMFIGPEDRRKVLRLKPWELRCMVNETFRQPKPGTRGRKPVAWRIAAQRIERMLMARDALRSKGDDVSKPAVLQWLGQRGSPKILDRWLDSAKLTWSDFLTL